MGHEFRAEVTLRDDAVQLVRKVLAQDARLVLLPSPSPTSLSVKWVDQQPGRTSSNEDLRVSFDDGLYVVFHSATRAQRHALLHVLATQLATAGHSIRFEEL